ncbi:MAG: methylmalonyl-CoA mutase, partial [Rhizobiaceae bacterium]
MDPALIETADFGQQDEAAWRAAALKALKGQPFDALVSTGADGFRFGPLSPRRPDPDHLWKADAGTPWTVMARVDDPDPARAARQACDDLMNGATGLAVVFEGAPNAFGYGLPANPDALATVLDGVDLS